MSKSQNLSITAFQEQFGTEEKCYEYLVKARWANGFICPACGHNHGYLLNNKRYQCSSCRKQTSVTAGTVMHKTHLPLTKWFLAFYLVSQDKRGISALKLSGDLGVQYQTAWKVLKRIRSAMGERDQTHLLSGIIEFDDFYVGTPSVGEKRGRGTDKAKIFVALSLTDDGKPSYLKMGVTEDLKKESVRKFAEENFKPDSKIRSDGYRSYIPALEAFDHEHQVYDPDKDMLHWLHIAISNLKAFISGTYHGLGKIHLQAYLDEFCFRYSRRFFHANLLDRLAIAVATSSPC